MSDMRTALVIEGRVDPSLGTALRKTSSGVGQAGATTVNATGAATKALAEQAAVGRTLASSTTGVGKAAATAARSTNVLGEATRRTERETRSAGGALRRWARETRRTDSALGRTVRSVEKARLAFKRFSRERAEAFNEAGGAGGLGDLVSGAAAGMAARTGFREALAFEDAGVRLGTVINAQDPEKALGAAMQHARDYARRNLATETEILNIQYALNSAGMDAELARVGAGVVSKVKTVTGGAAEGVGEVLATVYNNLGHQLDGTVEERFTRVGELLTKTQFKFQIRDFNQLGESFKTGAGAIARFNVPLAQGATLLGALNSAGLQGSEAGTSMTAVFRQLTKAQEDLGVEIVRGTNGQMDAIATLANVREALDAFDIDERNAIMQEVFGDEGAKGLTPLLLQLDKLRADQKDVEEGSRKLIDKSYGEFLEGGSGPLTMFMDNLKSVGATIGSTLLPAVNSILWPMNEMLITVGELVEEFPLLGQSIGLAAAGFAAFKAYRVLRGVGGLLGGLRRARAGGGGAVGGLASALTGGATGGVMAVRVVNWPAGGVGGLGADGRRGRRGGAAAGGRGILGRLRGAGSSIVEGGRGLAAGRGAGGLLKGGGKLLGRVAAPVAVGLAALDVAGGISNGDPEQVGGGVGGLGGGMAGAAAGAALGSVVPVIGTAIGGLVGGAIGAFGGEWLGRKVGGLFGSDDDADEGKEVVRRVRYDAMGNKVYDSADEKPAAAANSPAASPELPTVAAPVVAEAATAGGSSRTISNTFHVAIHGAPGQDVEALADAVMKRLKAVGREALFD